MQYRQCGGTDLQLSAVTFGAWAAGGWMWGGSEPKAAVAAIRASYDLGVTSIDTAPAYGQGLSEEIVGEAIQGIPRDKVQILTKYGLRWDVVKGKFYFDSTDNNGRPIAMYRYAAREGVVQECEASLRRLKTDYIDLYQIHWADPTTPIEETMETVASLIKQGKVRHAAVCNYTAAQMAEAEKTVRLASNQVPYSMLRRDIEKEIVPYCIKNKKGILVYSPLERGVLTGKFKPGHVFGDGDTRAGEKFYQLENLIRVNTFLGMLKPLTEEKNISLVQLVIAWTVHQPGITACLVGARNPDQALHNAKGADVRLSSEDLEFIESRIVESALV
ncbi:MAG TPA: aldo/keto reductase [Bacteroidota bacterium]|nr:aldo/keto reductase [Bacteroidota bacterium]